jgi:hypothetical protein
MATAMNRTTTAVRSAQVLPALGFLIGLAACTNLLEVEQRGLITEEQLKQQRIVDAVIAAALGDYHVAFNWVAHSGASATDEAIFGHIWTPWNDYDERDLSAEGCPHDNCGFGYGWMQRARVTGVRSAQHLKELQAPDTAIAHALEYAGYSTVMLADHLCQVPLNGGPPLDPAVAYDSAIAVFQEALTFAGGNARFTNLANVGIARSYLNKNDLNHAIEYATKVDPAFEGWVRFVSSGIFDDWSTKYNLFRRTTMLESNTALDPAEWATKRDLRVPFETDSTRAIFSPHPESHRGYLPYTPYSFAGWTPGNTDTISGGADIRFASGLEARYIIAEASLYGGMGGWTQGQVQAFIDERRAVGGHGPYTGSTATDALAAELREQRKMDFFFAGYRMPDLIRYKKYRSVDLWPRGVMGGYGYDRNGQPPQTTPPWRYGNVECWPVAQTEVNTNPNFP